MFLNPQKNLEELSIGRGAHVADFGAGSGHYALAVARIVGEDGKVFCIDINGEMLTKVKNHARQEGLENLDIIKSDLEGEKGSKLQNESVELVIIANTLFALEKKEEVVQEAFRILRPKGRVLVVEWSDSFAGLGPHTSHIVTKEETQKIFESTKFKLEREISAGDHHYGLIFRK